MNDVGDVITPTELTGPGITSQNKIVLWRRDAVLQRWYPLLQGGQSFDGHTVLLPSAPSLGSLYWQLTGGSDGFGLGFNDAGQLAMKIKFTDGLHGVYVLRPRRKASSRSTLRDQFPVMHEWHEAKREAEAMRLT